MTRKVPVGFFVALMAALFLVVMVAPAARADGSHLVDEGETLSSIARRYGVSVRELAEANRLHTNSWVYLGQRLRIPAARDEPAVSVGTTYTVQPGDTLFRVALNHRTSVQALMTANDLVGSTIYVGQRLLIPGPGGTVMPPIALTVPSGAGDDGKWIRVDLLRQVVTAYKGRRPVYTALASTGLPRTPTIRGTFKIYVKYPKTDMRGGSVTAGDYYYLHDVPHTMYFYRGYGLHGAYWHNNFGQPMSHGCVNLSLPDAKWFYEWAPVGTTVVVE